MNLLCVIRGEVRDGLVAASIPWGRKRLGLVLLPAGFFFVGVFEFVRVPLIPRGLDPQKVMRHYGIGP